MHCHGDTANDLGLPMEPPGDRVIGVQEHLQPEKVWVCVRRGDRRGITEEECENCPHWEALPKPARWN